MQNKIITERECKDLDSTDKLSMARDEFVIPDNVIYMDGNSLGAMPKAASARVKNVVENEWGQDLIRSWNTNNWFKLPYRIGDKIASLVGAEAGEVVVTDCVSVNLYKVLIAALRMQEGRTRIVTEAGNFPTDLYMLQGVNSTMGESLEIITIAERDNIIQAIDKQTAVVLLTDVHYKTGHLLDKKAITARAREQGALVIWDLCHSAGALPVDLNGIEADLAVGCSYKYLNGGPGAPGFLFVAKRHLKEIQQPLSGWWGHSNPFEFKDDYQPATGIGRMLSGTQGILGLTCMEVGVDITLRYGIKEIRQKSKKMGDLFIALFDQLLTDYDFELVSPREAESRGSQISFKHEKGYAIMQALIERGVIGDFRAPDILRFGFAPLYLRYHDIWKAVTILADIMENRTWDKNEYAVVNAVT